MLDPQHSSSRIISTKSYNNLVYKLVEYKNLPPLSTCKASIDASEDDSKDSSYVMIPEDTSSSSIPTSPDPTHSLVDSVGCTVPSNEELYHDGPAIESFLNETSSQLTYYGLLCLYQVVRERELCVFFRNNHFSTMFRMNDRC